MVTNIYSIINILFIPKYLFIKNFYILFIQLKPFYSVRKRVLRCSSNENDYETQNETEI